MPPSGPPLFWKLLLPPYFFFIGLVTVVEVATHSGKMAGFLSGAAWSAVLSVVWLIAVLPWALLVAGLWRRSWLALRWRGLRAALILAPALFVCGKAVERVIRFPPTQRGFFLYQTGAPFPEHAVIRQWRGCGMALRGVTYFSFTSPASETEALIRQLELKPVDKYRVDHNNVNPLDGFAEGDAISVFQPERPRVTLYVNQTRELVFLRVHSAAGSHD